jgi:hypothetical protein
MSSKLEDVQKLWVFVTRDEGYRGDTKGDDEDRHGDHDNEWTPAPKVLGH